MQEEHARAQLLVSLIQDRADRLVHRFEDSIARYQAEVSALQDGTFRWTLFFLTVVPLVALAVGGYVLRSVAGPLSRLREGAARLAEGDLDTPHPDRHGRRVRRAGPAVERHDRGAQGAPAQAGRRGEAGRDRPAGRGPGPRDQQPAGGDPGLRPAALEALRRRRARGPAGHRGGDAPGQGHRGRPARPVAAARGPPRAGRPPGALRRGGGPPLRDAGARGQAGGGGGAGDRGGRRAQAPPGGRQPGAKRRRGVGARRAGGARVWRRRASGSHSACRIPDPASRRRSGPACSSRSSPARSGAPGWAWPSRRGSWRPTAARSAPRPWREGGPGSRSGSRDPLAALAEPIAAGMRAPRAQVVPVCAPAYESARASWSGSGGLAR